MRLINDRWTPIWTGTLAGSQFAPRDSVKLMVRMARDDERIWATLDIHLGSPPNCVALTKHTAIEPGSNAGLLPSLLSATAKVRAAAVLGIAPFSLPGPGLSGSLPPLANPRIVGLDIEQTTFVRHGSFPLSHDPLISIAIVTWDNRYLCGYAVGFCDEERCCPTSSHKVFRFRDSRSLADWAMDWLVKESPDFVAIHNGFKYDIGVLASHCSPFYASYFVALNLGKSDKGHDLVIPGVTVIDTFWFMHKLHNSEYTSFNLDSFAAILGERGKLSHPSMSIDTADDTIDITRMLMYNVHDAYLHVKVALGSRCLEEICTMCSVFKSPISDITRFISGTAVCSMISSFSISRGLLMDWSEEAWERVTFKGAHVIQPKVGLHRSVLVLDFASMYPSIIVSANISPETMHRVEDEKERESIILRYRLTKPEAEGDVSIGWDESRVAMWTSSVIFYSDRTVEGVSSLICKELIARRSRLPDKDTCEGWTMKIGTNSIYGVFGAKTSGLSCKLAAVAVTAIGRFILSSLIDIARDAGMEVLYGDTDSIFICSPDGQEPDSDRFIAVYESRVSNTPFSLVRLEKDKMYSSIILVKPKIYYGKVRGQCDQKPVVKGMASKRRDRPDISRETLRQVCDIICSDASFPFRALSSIAELLWNNVRRLRRGEVPVIKCMKEIRVDGSMMYCYRAISGRQIMIDKSKFDGSLPEQIDTEWILSSIESSLSGVLMACDLPSVSRMVELYESTVTSIEDLF